MNVVIDSHSPTPEFAMQFLYKLLDDKNGKDRYEYNNIVKELCKVISKGNLKIENIEHYISQGISDFNMLPLYSITPDVDKMKLIEYGKTSFQNVGFLYMLSLCTRRKLFLILLKNLKND